MHDVRVQCIFCRYSQTQTQKKRYENMTRNYFYWRVIHLNWKRKTTQFYDGYFQRCHLPFLNSFWSIFRSIIFPIRVWRSETVSNLFPCQFVKTNFHSRLLLHFIFFKKIHTILRAHFWLNEDREERGKNWFNLVWPVELEFRGQNMVWIMFVHISWTRDIINTRRLLFYRRFSFQCVI